MDERMEQEEEQLARATEQLGEMECDDRASEPDDLDEEQRDQLGDMSHELWAKIRDEKKAQPSMFVSGWEEDDANLEPGDQARETEQFLTAAENGDLATMQRLFSKDAGLLAARDRDRYTPLHRAAYNNQVEAVEWLLAVGADPESRTEDGWTVLHSAACWAAADIVAALLKRGVDVNSRSNGQLTPLHLAINSSAEQEPQLRTIKYLLDTPGIEMNALTRAGETPAQLARRASAHVLDVLDRYLRRP